MQVAITGGIGEGKSTVLSMLQKMGYRTISADAVARDIFQESAVNARLAELAGQKPPISPTALRSAITADDHVRRQVNRLMHPLVMNAIKNSEAQFIEVPLLIEACLHPRFSAVWVVTCGAEDQRTRLLARYGDQNIVESMLAAQLPTVAKIPFADAIIRTNQPLENVQRLLSEAVAGLGA